MTIQLFAFIIFIFSVLGIIFILYRKIPQLLKLPQKGTFGIKEHHYFLEAERRMEKFFINFEKQVYLHRLLSWVKVMTMKLEIRIDHLLHGIRKKAQKLDEETKRKLKK